MNLQPIDGEYFRSAYFCLTTIIALIVSCVGVLMDEEDI